jgi:hypothetical protein
MTPCEIFWARGRRHGALLHAVIVDGNNNNNNIGLVCIAPCFGQSLSASAACKFMIA